MSKCVCGCGQANSGRLRKLECELCGYIAYTSRTRINEGLPSCPCGGLLVPPCVHDRVAIDGPLGDEAYAEIQGRQCEFMVRSERARKGAQTRKVGRAVKAGQAKRAAVLASASIPF